MEDDKSQDEIKFRLSVRSDRDIAMATPTGTPQAKIADALGEAANNRLSFALYPSAEAIAAARKSVEKAREIRTSSTVTPTNNQHIGAFKMADESNKPRSINRDERLGRADNFWQRTIEAGQTQTQAKQQLQQEARTEKPPQQK